MAGLTFLRVVGNDELRRQEEAERLQSVTETQSQPLLTGFAAYLRQCWDAAYEAKQPIEREMLRAMRQRNGQYEADKLAEIQRTGGSTLYMMLTEVKCRAAESWLRDILLDTGEPPWDIEPTPIPDLSPIDEEQITAAFGEEVTRLIQTQGMAPTGMQAIQLRNMVEQDYRFEILRAAQKRVDGMRRKIDDQFTEGGWLEAFNEFITDLVTYPCGFIKGPIVRRQRTLKWDQDELGRTIAVPDERLVPQYERVDPFRVYPEPGITHINDGYIFQHHPMTRSELADLIGVPGYDKDAIREILDHPSKGYSWINPMGEQLKESLEGKYSTWRRPTAMYDALEFWGKVSGKMLLDWGIEPEQVPDPAREYDANVWIVGSYVIKATLNYDPLGQKPYTKTSFIKKPGAFWGRGIPSIIEDVQSVCNAAARALVNNMGIASGPQVEVNIDRLPPNEDITQMYPWKIWQVVNDPLAIPQPAVRFHQPDDRAGQLMAVYERFARMADDQSGIPAYIYGDTDVKGAGRTASGLSMLMGSAGKGIRQVVMHIDNDIIRKIVERQFIYNMRYDDDESIKGDIRIVARGVVNLAVKETVNMRRLEFLNATGNEIDMQIVGIEGRAALLREIAKGLSMPVDDIVPSKEKLTHTLTMSAQQQAQQPAPAELQPGGEPVGDQRNTQVMNQATGGTT